MIKIILKNYDELAETISENLPLSTEDAYDFIIAVNKGYTWGNVDYAMAISVRDQVIERLMRENKMLLRKNENSMKSVED